MSFKEIFFFARLLLVVARWLLERKKCTRLGRILIVQTNHPHWNLLFRERGNEILLFMQHESRIKLKMTFWLWSWDFGLFLWNILEKLYYLPKFPIFLTPLLRMFITHSINIFFCVITHLLIMPLKDFFISQLTKMMSWVT